MASIILLGFSLLALLIGLYLTRKDYIIVKGLAEPNMETQKAMRTALNRVDSTDAKTVKEMTEAVATEEEIFKLLKPVLDSAHKESRKGNFSSYVHGMDWYYGTNAKYAKAISKLKEMGYRIEYRPAMTGITIRWD